MPCCFLEDAIPLDEMRSEDETKLIESKDRGSVAAPKERKNAFRDLGHNEIIFKHRQAIVADPANTEVLGNVIQSFPRNRVVNVIEGTTCPAPWL